MKQMEVTIMGQSYLLGCPPGGETALTTAVAQVDREMSAIRDAGKVKARERIAVLAALNLAYQLAETPKETSTEAPREASSSMPVSSAEVDTLIKRLDEALGHDGQLL
ncbi:cell division protein ZapA [Roseateles sp.]|uniref:cell division protein ZapA n=1 Tax=Roseateles sp. TaxID=1971397 RepID=UPI0032672289